MENKHPPNIQNAFGSPAQRVHLPLQLPEIRSSIQRKFAC